MNKYVFTLTLLAHTCLIGMSPWQRPTYNCTATLQTGPVTCIALSPDKQRIATGSANGVVGIWDIATQKCVLGLNGDETPILSLKFGSNNFIESIRRDREKIKKEIFKQPGILILARRENQK